MSLSAKKRTAFTVIILLMVLCVSEFASWGVLSFLRGHIVTHAELRAMQNAIATIPHEKEQEAWVKNLDQTQVMLHPYVGYTVEDNLMERSAHAGESGAVIVGITGGSVARHFGMYPFANEPFLKRLQEIPTFAGRKIILLNLAMDGYKEPQQMQQFTYMLTQGVHFDVFITLDGVNEVIHTGTNVQRAGDSYLYPIQWSSRVNMYRKRISNAEFDRLTARRIFTAKCVRKIPIVRDSFTINALWAGADMIMKHEIQKPFVADMNDRSYEAHGPMHDDLVTHEASWQAQTDVWANASEMMNTIAKSKNTAFFHFLQPNQYVPNSKPMNSEEIALAKNLKYFEYDIETWYPALQERGKKLQAKGISFHDLTQIFANVRQPMYIDACCHLSQSGSLIMGQAMADVIVKELTPAK